MSSNEARIYLRCRTSARDPSRWSETACHDSCGCKEHVALTLAHHADLMRVIEAAIQWRAPRHVFYNKGDVVLADAVDVYLANLPPTPERRT